jgi:hypothetical protein
MDLNGGTEATLDDVRDRLTHFLRTDRVARKTRQRSLDVKPESSRSL